ncbi:MAG: hypothetical protein VXZ53_17795, partial [Planctomycetota bacterium]|nr:hypothetical protein [Planctomycetota bacterium]
MKKQRFSHVNRLSLGGGLDEIAIRRSGCETAPSLARGPRRYLQERSKVRIEKRMGGTAEMQRTGKLKGI